MKRCRQHEPRARPSANRVYPKGFLPILSSCTATAVLRTTQLLSAALPTLARQAGDGDRHGKGRQYARKRCSATSAAPNPEGYRKALRLMRQAEKFHRPVVCFVDTSGAFCGIGAEERGQGAGHRGKSDGNDGDFERPYYRCAHRRGRQRRCTGAGRGRSRSGCWKTLFIR